MGRRTEMVNGLIRKIINDICVLGETHELHEVFRDYLLIFAYSTSNACDKVHYNAREAEYLKTINKYSKKNQDILIDSCTKFVAALELSHFERDLFGEIFNELNLLNKNIGQNFTKSGVQKVLSQITLDNCEIEIEQNGYFVMNEPTCGSGSLVIAMAEALLSKGFSPTHNMCVYATDVDWRCAMMTYIQLSYLGIPAVVARADCLKVEEYDRFYTPAYIVDNWVWKQKLGMTDAICTDDEKLKCVVEPMYGIMKYGFKKKEERK